MTDRGWAVLLAALLWPVATLADASKVDPSIAEAVGKFTATFNRFDPKATAAFWAEDGTLVSPVGEWGKGRAGVEKVFAHDVETILKGTTSTFRVENVRKLPDGYALLDLEHEVQNARMPDGTTGTMKLHLVLLARKKGGSWQWVDARPYAFLRPPPSAK